MRDAPRRCSKLDSELGDLREVEESTVTSSLDLLHEVSLFRLLDPAELEALLNHMARTQLDEGEMLFYQGEPGLKLFVVESGRVEIYLTDDIGQHIGLLNAGPGEIIGELSVLDGQARSANARALEPTELLVLSREDLEQYLEEKPTVALDILAVMSQRIRATDALLQSRVSRNTNEIEDGRGSWVLRVALAVAQFSGSIPFFVAHAVLFALWVIINEGMIRSIGVFDPFPYELLSTLVGIEAIFLSTLVLLAQNVQLAKDRIRADVEYEVNLKAELKVAELHRKLDHFRQEMLKRFESLSRRH